MRVTDQMLSNRLLTNINRNLNLLNKYNTQASSGKKIQVASDDPIIASRALKFRTMLAESEQYTRNVQQATSWVEVTQNAFVNINTILIDMKGLLEQGANDTYSTEDRKKILTEYMSLLEQLEQELNTDYMGRYIFSGFRTDTKPVIQDVNGNNVLNPQIYGNNVATSPIASIDGQKIEIQVGSGVSVEVNILATDIYDESDFYNLRGGKFDPTQNNNYNYEGNTEFDRIYNFLNSENYANMTDEQKLEWEKDPENDLRGMMSSMLTTVETFTSKVSVQDTNIGVISKRLALVEQRLQDDQTNYTEVMSNNEDIDLAEVMMNYNTANAAYLASLNIGMKINQATLADYL